MHRRLPVGTWDGRVVLAGLFAAIGLAALAFSTLAPVVSSYPGVGAWVALTAAVAAAALLVAPRRWGRWVTYAGLLVSSLLIALLVAVRATPQGQASAGYLLILPALFCAVYLTHRQMLVQLGVLFALFAAVSMPWSEDHLHAFYVGVHLAVVLLVAEVVSRLMTRQRELMAELQERAVHDPLTGALNRRGALEEAEQVRAVVGRAGGQVTVNAVDLDGFKALNDSRGHAAGDQLLMDLVSDWSATLRAGDLLARVGGDEFVLVLPNTDADTAAILLDRMRTSNPFRWSVGTVVWDPEEDLFDAVARADQHLYAHKLQRRCASSDPPPGD